MTRQEALHVVAARVWDIPGRFGIARILGPSYSLRCVLFHHICAAESPFTNGIGVTMGPASFEAALRFLTTHYTPVRLADVLADPGERALPPRAVLVTFDDSYASLAEVAAPLCAQLDVPSIFFINAAFLDNRRLAPDNLVCYVANVMGMEVIRAAARAVKCDDVPAPESLRHVFTRFFPVLSLAQREAFLRALIDLSGIEERCLAEEARLYLTSSQLAGLAGPDREIGNHTYTHVHGRCLSPEDVSREIDRNKAELEGLTGRRVRAFSVPYGSSADLSSGLVDHLRHSGHEAVFLSESVANTRGADRLRLDRVSTQGYSEDRLFLQIEILPRLRRIWNRLYRGTTLAIGSSSVN